MVVAEGRVRAPPVCTASAVCIVRQVVPDLLHPLFRRVSASARMDPRPPVAQPLVGVVEPDAHPLAARARPAVEDRTMA
jgi:hypothetical protein